MESLRSTTLLRLAAKCALEAMVGQKWAPSSLFGTPRGTGIRCLEHNLKRWMFGNPTPGLEALAWFFFGKAARLFSLGLRLTRPKSNHAAYL